MWEKLSKRLLRLCEIFEVMVALLVLLGIAATLFSYLIPGMLKLFGTTTGTEHFLVYLADIFNLVVGLEFMKLLCRISSDNIIEVLVILIARHMILESHTALDLFLSVLSITLLLLLRAALHWLKLASAKKFASDKNLKDEI